MLSTPVAPAMDVPARVDRVSGLAVQLVDTKAEARLLARLLHDEHPQGAVQHGGRPWRYLITSDHGVLGGFEFARPALALKPRGWDGTLSSGAGSDRAWWGCLGFSFARKCSVSIWRQRPWGTVDGGYRRILRRVTLLCLCFVRCSQEYPMRA